MNVIIPNRRKESLFEQRILRSGSQIEIVSIDAPFGKLPLPDEQRSTGPMRSLQNDSVAHAVLTNDRLILTNSANPEQCRVVDFVRLSSITDISLANRGKNRPVDSPTMSLLVITSELEGHDHGRTYELQVDADLTAQKWKEGMQRAISSLSPQRTPFQDMLAELQTATKDFYALTRVQFVFAVFIFFNFVASVVEAELKVEDGSREQRVFLYMEWGFTIFFIIELLINLVSCSDKIETFFFDRFKMFDLIVVVCSLLSLLLSSIPGLGVLRVMRAFRIMRLFGRLESLRDIMKALMCSWMPVVNAMMIVFFTTAVYAILANEFFADMAPFHFDRFSRSFFTMFTVITFDGWVDMVYTEMTLDDGTLHAGVVLFFGSFIVIVVWTMMSVVVAIMLDNFTKEAEKADVAPEDNRYQKCLDPLLSTLITFTNARDLKRRASALFFAMDVEQQGRLSCLVFCDMLRKIHFKTAPGATSVSCAVSAEEFYGMTRSGNLCDVDGCLGPEGLERLLQEQLVQFVQETCSQELSRTEAVTGGWNAVAIVLASLKLSQMHHDTSDVAGRLGRLETLVEAMAKKIVPELSEDPDLMPLPVRTPTRSPTVEGAALAEPKSVPTEAPTRASHHAGVSNGSSGPSAAGHVLKSGGGESDGYQSNGSAVRVLHGAALRANGQVEAVEVPVIPPEVQLPRQQGRIELPARMNRMEDATRHEIERLAVSRRHDGIGGRGDGGPQLEYSKRARAPAGGLNPKPAEPPGGAFAAADAPTIGRGWGSPWVQEGQGGSERRSGEWGQGAWSATPTQRQGRERGEGGTGGGWSVVMGDPRDESRGSEGLSPRHPGRLLPVEKSGRELTVGGWRPSPVGRVSPANSLTRSTGRAGSPQHHWHDSEAVVFAGSRTTVTGNPGAGLEPGPSVTGASRPRGASPLGERWGTGRGAGSGSGRDIARELPPHVTLDGPWGSGHGPSHGHGHGHGGSLSARGGSSAPVVVNGRMSPVVMHGAPAVVGAPVPATRRGSRGTSYESGSGWPRRWSGHGDGDGAGSDGMDGRGWSAEPMDFESEVLVHTHTVA